MTGGFKMRGGLKLAVLAAAGLLTVGGCAARKGPFEDVTARTKSEPTMAQTQSAPQAAVPGTQPVAQAAMKSGIGENTSPKPETRNPKPDSALSPQPPEPAASSAAPATQPLTPIIVTSQGPGLIQRLWPLSTNHRPSGDVLIGHVYNFPLPAREESRPEWQSGVLEPVEYLTSIILLPVRMAMRPPWTTTTVCPAGPSSTPMGPASVADGQAAAQAQSK